MKIHYSQFKKAMLGLSTLFIGIFSFAQCEFGNYGANFTELPGFVPNFLLGTRHYNATSSTITHLGMAGNGTNAGVQMAIYSDNSGAPGTLLGYTALHTVDSGNLYFPISPFVANVGYYWIMAIYDNTGTNNNHTYMNWAQDNTIYYASLTFGNGVPNNFSGNSYSGGDFIYWATAMEIENIDVISCGPYTWSANGETYTSSTQQEVLVEDGGANGCHLLKKLDLQVISALNNTVTVNGNTLTADLTGNTYQWLDCDNNLEPVSGATSSSFSPAQSGNYAVHIITNDCISTSPCTAITVNTSSISVIETEQMVLYPNPAGMQFSITNTTPGTHISIIDVTGKVLISETAGSTKHSIRTDNLPNGMYIVQLEQNGQISQKKLVVNKQ